MWNDRLKIVKIAVLGITTLGVSGIVYLEPSRNQLSDIPNRIPEAAPYVLAEAQAFPPPYHDSWEKEDSPAQCQTCHEKIFDEWNGSMMSNAWRDPAWRAAFLLAARTTSTNGECDTPQPPDGTTKAQRNPFAKEGECASVFDIGAGKHKVSRSGSLLDFFCSRCHMPTDYVDNIPLKNVLFDAATHKEMAVGDPRFNPTSDNQTGIAFAKSESQLRNTESGKSGIICAVCHTFAETRETPFHNYVRGQSQYTPAPAPGPRSDLLASAQQDIFNVPDPGKQNLGYSIGAGSFRLSPHAIGFPERFGPLSANQAPTASDSYTSGVFGRDIPYQRMDPSKHHGYRQEIFARSEMCAACHDVTNALPIRNPLGKWVGGFPIERTYTEWANSAYADRPGNRNYDPRFKRDCQTCHMQQDFGQPGTAQTLYKDGRPLPPEIDRVANEGGSPHPFFTHHFVGGNAYVTRLIGKDLEEGGSVAPYPELSAFSFSSADHKSDYSRAFWTNPERRGAYTQQARLAWDRLRNVLTLDIQGSATVNGGSSVPVSITVANTGSGHNFPTGFPEGSIAWLAIHAHDLATGKELPIHDNVWNRTTIGVGNLTTEDTLDPNFPGCNWKLPAGSVDPYSMQFKAVATLGDGCPTLDLPYATPLNLVTNKKGLPLDEQGRIVNAANPSAPVFRDINRNSDDFDDSFLRDTRLKPRGRPEYQVKIDRYSVVVPAGTQGPIAVSAAVYYQSVEAIVALKFLGNLADTNRNFILEPCVLGGLCDERKPTGEPAVVEGAPPVPMVVRNLVITIPGAAPHRMPPQMVPYPASAASHVNRNVVVKAIFSEPVNGINADSFTLTDSRGRRVSASVDQIAEETWGLFPDQVLLKRAETYRAQLNAGICDLSGNCTRQPMIWKFTVASEADEPSGESIATASGNQLLSGRSAARGYVPPSH